MNRERAKELLPIIEAFAEGKAIQYKRLQAGDYNWYDLGGVWSLNDITASEKECEYRIKPKPREFYLYPESVGCGIWDGAGNMYVTTAPLETRPTNAIHVREVLDD